MTAVTRHRIVAGIEGSQSALGAVSWATHTAIRHHCVLELVAIVPEPTAERHPHSVEEARRQGFVTARRMLDEAAGVAATAAKGSADTRAGFEVKTSVRWGSPVDLLIDSAAGADMLVIASRDLGSSTLALMGSTAIAVASHAPCPVVVVRATGQAQRRPDSGPVVVGVDAADSCREAVRFAFEEAAQRKVPLYAVHASNDPATDQSADSALLTGCLSDGSALFPDVTVQQVIARDTSPQALIESAEIAQLLVVAALGTSEYPGLRIGSTGNRLLHAAHCPLAIVRHDGESAT